MNDMTAVIVPKSDQINADDLISGPMTITIREVQIKGGQEQPVSIYFDGSDKAFRPCKSMSRVLVAAWGPDAKTYVGRSLTLYRDPTVKWGGLEVGGIRISHMTHIDAAMTMALTATKGSRKPYTVRPLTAPAVRTSPGASLMLTEIAACKTAATLRQWWNQNNEAIADADYDQVLAAFNDRLAAVKRPDTASPENPTAAEGPADEDRGERFTGADDAFAGGE